VRFPVFIGLRRSKILISALSLMHCAAAGAMLAISWPLPVRIVLLVALAGSLPYSLRPPRVVSLRLYGDGGLECVLPDGTALPATPLPDSAVFFWLVVLRLKAEDEGESATISLPLLPDSMSREEFRILRLWLRWGANSASPPDTGA
jgi:hypothetical protein